MTAGAACLFASGAGSAPLIAGDHYEENIRRSNCSNTSATACALPMAFVPAGKNLLVTNVSCSVSYGGGGTPTFHDFYLGRRNISFAVGTVDAGSPPFTYLNPVLVPFTGSPSAKHYVVNVQTNQLFKAGQVPYFYQNISSATFGDFDCTIFGTLISTAS